MQVGLLNTNDILPFAPEQVIEGLTGDTLAIDSTMYDTHHFTRHYERRRSQHAGGDKQTILQRKSETMKKMPKLAVGSDTRSHLVKGMITRTGQCSDAQDFHWLMIDAWCLVSLRSCWPTRATTPRRITSWQES